MESLLKMSGLLTDEEAGKSDLGAIERRLAEKARSGSTAKSASPRLDNGSTPAPTAQRRSSTSATPQHQESQASPRGSVATPTTSPSEKPPEVENLSDMMCSLVTNTNGETRYIGMVYHLVLGSC